MHLILVCDAIYVNIPCIYYAYVCLIEELSYEKNGSTLCMIFIYCILNYETSCINMDTFLDVRLNGVMSSMGHDLTYIYRICVQ